MNSTEKEDLNLVSMLNDAIRIETHEKMSRIFNRKQLHYGTAGR